MTVAACADVHIGNIPAHGGRKIGGLNRRANWTIGALSRAVDTCDELGATMVVLGDLFDVSSPNPALLADVQDVLRVMERKPHILVGNHDMNSTASRDNACAPLADVAHVWSRPGVADLGSHHVGWMVPFQPGPASEWLEDAVRQASDAYEDDGRRIVLCLHLGIADGDTPVHLEGHDDSVHIDQVRAICGSFGIHEVVAGNWHWRQEWDLAHPEAGKVIQCGTLAPVRHSDAGFDGLGGVQILHDDGSYSYVQVEGPRFVTARNPNEAAELIAIAKAVGAAPLFLRTRYDFDDDSWRDLSSRIELAAEEDLEVVLKTEDPESADEDDGDLAEDVARLSELPVHDAIVEVTDEVAKERDVDPSALRSTVDEIWREVGT